MAAGLSLEKVMEQEVLLDTKKLARRLQVALKSLGVPIKMGTAQEAMAQIAGYGNWRTLVALHKNTRKPANRPRVLVTVSGGVADYVCTPDVDCFVFDWDNFEADPDWTGVAPADFADLAAPINVPYAGQAHESVDRPSKTVTVGQTFAQSVWDQECLQKAREEAKAFGGSVQEFTLAGVYPEPAEDLTALMRRIRDLEAHLNPQEVLQFRQDPAYSEVVFLNYALITQPYRVDGSAPKD